MYDMTEQHPEALPHEIFYGNMSLDGLMSDPDDRLDLARLGEVAYDKDGKPIQSLTGCKFYPVFIKNTHHPQAKLPKASYLVLKRLRQDVGLFVPCKLLPNGQGALGRADPRKLSDMVDRGLVEQRIEGNSHFYRITEEGIDALEDHLEQMRQQRELRGSE